METESFQTYSMFDQSYIDPRYIHKFTHDTFVLYYRIRNEEQYPANSRGKILHVLSRDFAPTSISLIRQNDIWDMTNPFNRAQVGRNVRICVIDSSLIFFASRFYDGSLYRCFIDQEDWVVSLVNGKKPYQVPYKNHDIADKEKGIRHPRSILSNSPAGRFYTTVNNLSVGVFGFGANEVVQFVLMTKSDDELVFGCNLFSIAGDFLGFFEIKELGLEGNDIFSLEVLWQDKDGKFYLRDSRNYGMIRVLSISKEKH